MRHIHNWPPPAATSAVRWLPDRSQGCHLCTACHHRCMVCHHHRIQDSIDTAWAFGVSLTETNLERGTPPQCAPTAADLLVRPCSVSIRSLDVYNSACDSLGLGMEYNLSKEVNWGCHLPHTSLCSSEVRDFCHWELSDQFRDLSQY